MMGNNVWLLAGIGAVIILAISRNDSKRKALILGHKDSRVDNDSNNSGGLTFMRRIETDFDIRYFGD